MQSWDKTLGVTLRRQGLEQACLCKPAHAVILLMRLLCTQSITSAYIHQQKHTAHRERWQDACPLRCQIPFGPTV